MTHAAFSVHSSRTHMGAIVAVTMALLLGVQAQSAAQPLTVGGYSLVRDGSRFYFIFGELRSA